MRCIAMQGKGNNVLPQKGKKGYSFGPDMPKVTKGSVQPIKSVAIPAISVGRFAYPIAEAVSVVVDTLLDGIKKWNTGLEEIILVFWPGGSAFDKTIAAKSFKEHVLYLKTKAKKLSDLKLVE